MAKPAPRCVRCNQRMRNNETADAPVWVCNNPACVRYVPAPKKGKKGGK